MTLRTPSPVPSSAGWARLLRPLSPAELLAAALSQRARSDELRIRGWDRRQSYTRADVADWTLDRWRMRHPLVDPDRGGPG